MTARVSMLLKSRASLTCSRACFLPGRAISTPVLTYILLSKRMAYYIQQCNMFRFVRAFSKDGRQTETCSTVNGMLLTVKYTEVNTYIIL